MALTKKDKKDIVEIVKTQIIDAISELVIPAIDRVYQVLGEFKAENASQHADIERQINDLKIDTPSMRRFNDHEQRIKRLENQVYLS